MIRPIILSGGSGTRLWPVSRSLHPKQFISFINETTLFQDTILRLSKNLLDPLIICNEEHRFLAAEQLRQINKKSSGIILEPFGKNTAPAVALSAHASITAPHSTPRHSTPLHTTPHHTTPRQTTLHYPTLPYPTLH